MSVPGGKGLPSFGNPPVVETILGVQFVPLVKMKGFHHGMFLARLGAGWTAAQEAPIIPASFERFEDSPPFDLSFAFEVNAGPPTRFRVRNEAGNGMVQVQRDRLHYNWLGKGEAEYPRYPEVRKRFDEALETFLAFVSDQQLGEVTPNQWEVTYVNHLPRGESWDSTRGHLAALRLDGRPEVEGLETEGADLKLRFRIPPNRGRLHVESVQKPEAVQLTLTARGPASSLEEALGGLDMGREVIVTAFKTLTSDEAQVAWSPEP
jgi:uncharacterized protein (TIGR04255 family)